MHQPVATGTQPQAILLALEHRTLTQLMNHLNHRFGFLPDLARGTAPTDKAHHAQQDANHDNHDHQFQ
ncbi:hypothetical protein D3C75_365520 [compost metagenome]